MIIVIIVLCLALAVHFALVLFVASRLARVFERFEGALLRVGAAVDRSTAASLGAEREASRAAQAGRSMHDVLAVAKREAAVAPRRSSSDFGPWDSMERGPASEPGLQAVATERKSNPGRPRPSQAGFRPPSPSSPCHDELEP